MKISIDGDIDKHKGGRQGFLSMLSESLVSNHGFKLVGKKDKSDIHLNSISGEKKKGAINFLRIDGIYYDAQRLGKNKAIVKSAKVHDHVIFQSSFSKKNFEKITGVSVPSSIIFNGATRMVNSSSKNISSCLACRLKFISNYSRISVSYLNYQTLTYKAFNCELIALTKTMQGSSMR